MSTSAAEAAASATLVRALICAASCSATAARICSVNRVACGLSTATHHSTARAVAAVAGSGVTVRLTKRAARELGSLPPEFIWIAHCRATQGAAHRA
jgi:hypothetical protein